MLVCPACPDVVTASVNAISVGSRQPPRTSILPLPPPPLLSPSSSTSSSSSSSSYFLIYHLPISNSHNHPPSHTHHSLNPLASQLRRTKLTVCNSDLHPPAPLSASVLSEIRNFLLPPSFSLQLFSLRFGHFTTLLPLPLRRFFSPTLDHSCPRPCILSAHKPVLLSAPVSSSFSPPSLRI